MHCTLYKKLQRQFTIISTGKKERKERKKKKEIIEKVTCSKWQQIPTKLDGDEINGGLGSKMHVHAGDKNLVKSESETSFYIQAYL